MSSVWVHCAANMRVSAFLGLYRVIKQGWERASAFALLQGLWQPNDIWSSFIAAMLAKHRDQFGGETAAGDIS